MNKRVRMGMWKCNYTPKTGLMIKYLAMIMTKDELKTLLKKYVEAKMQHFGHYDITQKPNAL